MPKSSIASAHAECLQPMEPFQVRVGVVHDRALGQLDHEVRRLETRNPPAPRARPAPARHAADGGPRCSRDSRKPAAARHALRQAHKSRQASSNTQRPSSTICPHSSATGMKRPGISTPASGWRQRTSASTPSRLPVPRSTMGWYSRKNSLGERPANVRFQPQPLVQHILHVRLEQRIAVLARRLRVIHGDVGIAQKRFGTGREVEMRRRCSPRRALRSH